MTQHWHTVQIGTYHQSWFFWQSAWGRAAIAGCARRESALSPVSSCIRIILKVLRGRDHSTPVEFTHLILITLLKVTISPTRHMRRWSSKVDICPGSDQQINHRQVT